MRAAMLLLLAACGDNILPAGEPIGRVANLTIVAHQDDDLLFMQPDELEAVQGGAGTVNVYVTAGNNTQGVEYSEQRDIGLMAAYAQIAGSDAWSCGWIEVAGHAAQHCRLDTINASLLFLDYPDGGKDGSYPNSLLHLWEGTIDGADTIARRPTHYDQAGLIAAVAEIITDTQPNTIRTLEVSATHGRDHSDHMFVGALAVLAAAQTTTTAALISYRGYDTESEPENVVDPFFTRSFDALAHYEACVDGGAPCGEAAPTIDDAHDVWLHRRYGVGFRPVATGVLRLDGDQCASANSDGSLELVNCTGAPPWSFATDGTLHLADKCMQALLTGELVVGACDAHSAFRLDDEGHIWTGVPPVPTTGMDNDHGTCLAGSGGRVRAVLCGVTKIGTWTVEPAQVVSSRLTLGLTQTGRSVVLADADGDGKADLCELAATGVHCAMGRGDGTFSIAAPFGGPLAIDPESLVIGDIDADGSPDACGRASDGISCTFANGTTLHWTDAFADAVAVAGTDASLALVDANGPITPEICGLSMLGVSCAPRGGAAVTRSAWPPTDTQLKLADLDGDHHVDWCSLGTIASCGVDRDRVISDTGVPWSFALGGSAEPITGPVAFRDIDGDGLADLCEISGSTVRCARSQAYGFGPSFVIFTHDQPLTALWLGDLDGDGRRDLCVDDGTSIICQKN